MILTGNIVSNNPYITKTYTIKKSLKEITPLLKAENYSYIVCPDCGKEIYLFGESHIEEIAEKFGYDLLARIPMDPKLSALVDRGMIELMENDYMDKAAQAVIEKLNLSQQ